jgi:O-antigen/teichoic acid export membrane protein
LLFLLKKNNSLNAGTALWAIAVAASTAILFGFFRYKHHQLLGWPGKLNWNYANRVNWNVGKWLIGTNIVYWGGSQLVIYMAAGMLSVEAVGAMTATRNVVGVANVLFLAMENLVPSQASRIFVSRGAGDLNRYLIKVALVGGVGTLFIAAVAGLWPETWLHLFYGSTYKGYGWLILWWGLFNIIGFFHRPLMAGLRVLNHTRAIFIANLAGSIIAVITSVFALRYGGILGGMLSLCLIQAVILLILAVSYMRTAPSKNSGLKVAEHVLDSVRRRNG